MASLDVLGVALFTVLSVAFYPVRHRLFHLGKLIARLAALLQ